MTVTIGRRELLTALGGAAAVWPLAAGCDRPHGAAAIGTDGEVGCGDRAIAFGAIVGPLADDTRVAGIEQPMTAMRHEQLIFAAMRSTVCA